VPFYQRAMFAHFVHSRTLKKGKRLTAFTLLFLAQSASFPNGKHLRCLHFPNLFAQVQTFQKRKTPSAFLSFFRLHFVQEISMLFSRPHRRGSGGEFFYRFF